MDNTSNNVYDSIFAKSPDQKKQESPINKEKQLQKKHIFDKSIVEQRLKLGSGISENYNKYAQDSSRYHKSVISDTNKDSLSKKS